MLKFISKKNISILLVSILLVCFLVGCSKVPAGYQGIIVNLYGADKGVAEKPVGVGRYFLGWNEEMFLFPTFLQNYTWNYTKDSNNESITMQTSEGLSINSDVGITYSIKSENVVKVFQKYRLGIEEITNTFLRNMVRDAMNTVASTMTVEQLYGSDKEQFMDKVNKMVKENSLKDGLDVDKVYLIGSFRLPDSVINSINSKIQASQNAMKVENEVATAKAEAQKTIINAQATAQANLIVSKSLTPEFLQYQALQKWDGSLPKVSGGAVPFVNLNNEMKK
jgi:regulator of protease activity HflC (stomatin/prohibitin superfamily)